MPTFTYAARDEQGIVHRGVLDAMTEDEVVAALQHRGLLITSLARQGAGDGREIVFKPSKAPARRMHNSVKVDDQVLLCQQLATLIRAGVPLLKSLEVVSAQVESRTLLLALEAVRRDVAGGSTFKHALAKHPAVFSELWQNLVETGEASGHLAESLTQLAHHFEMAQHLQNEMRTALTYPAFLFAVAVLVLGVFVYWLIPKFATMFEQMEVELPALTKAVIGVSHFAQRYVVLIVLAAAAGYHLLRRYLRTSVGQWSRDRLLLSLPLFSGLFSAAQLAEFARGMATLLESGVPLLSSLEILERSATNKMFGRAIGHVRSQVKEGKSMAEPMAETALFPPMAVQMVQVGEEVGELARMVAQIADYFESRVETFIARMTRLFEPIAIIVMGGLVLIIVLAIFMPIFKMATVGPK